MALMMGKYRKHIVSVGFVAVFPALYLWMFGVHVAVVHNDGTRAEDTYLVVDKNSSQVQKIEPKQTKVFVFWGFTRNDSFLEVFSAVPNNLLVSCGYETRWAVASNYDVAINTDANSSQCCVGVKYNKIFRYLSRP